MTEFDVLTREQTDSIEVGDVVHTGANTFPQWRVIAIDGEKAWVRNVQTHADGVTDITRCEISPLGGDWLPPGPDFVWPEDKLRSQRGVRDRRYVRNPPFHAGSR